jgi:hypothetical protein
MSDAATRRLLAAAVVASTAWGVAAFEPAPCREVTNVAAFARLYGVVRYFYPSDAAAALDWERAAVHGVRRARTAADEKRLEITLKELFGPQAGTSSRTVPRSPVKSSSSPTAEPSVTPSP